ncbi:MAG TPA: glycosyltransferase, partial [Vicinamibacteria bacterium]|nr:glycosyltransferase [Vicinamibacteria bacterium]
WRGGQNQVLLTAKGMAARGHQVVLACQRGGVLEGRARAAGLDVRPLSFRGDLWPRAALGLARLLRDVAADAAQVHDPHALSAGVLARALGARAALVATRRVDFPLKGGLSRAKYRRAARVIAVSRAIADVLQSGGLRDDALRVVHEGVPDRAPQPGGRDVLRGLGLPPDALVVGNVAALTDHKDHETLLQAAAAVVARVPAARFVIVGEGELRAPLEARARALGVQDRCVFAGFRTDLDRLIPAFDVFCLSSHMEGLGTSLLDAMAFGRAIVATRAGGIPEAVADGVTGRVVAARDAASLAGALVDVLQDEATRAAYGAAGRRRFLEHFTSDLMVERTLGVLREVA